MPKRYTDSEKWNDRWFRKLSSDEKIMFLYLCDRCDLAGFYELDYELMSLHIGLDERCCIGAVKGLNERVQVKGEVVWIKNFLEHQKNLPLNPENNAHKHIIIKISNRLNLFPEIIDYIGADLGLFSPIGKGRGKGKGKGKGRPAKKSKFVPPILEEVIEYFAENGYSKAGATEAFKYYNEADWHDASGKPVLAWKQKMRGNQFREEYKIKITDKPDPPKSLMIWCDDGNCQERHKPFKVYPEKMKPPWICKCCNKEMIRV